MFGGGSRLAVRMSSFAGRALSTSARARVPIYQVDAFAHAPFEGNPAAVCPLDSWLSDDTLRSIAAENNLSETAFLVGRADGEWDLRWFTPTVEVDMCGHATLAAGSIVLGRLSPEAAEAAFHTRSGRLAVRRAAEADTYTLDFPLWPCAPDATAPPPALVAAVGAAPCAVHAIEPLHGAPYFLFEYATESEVRSLAPRFGAMEANVLATAPAASSTAGYDFVSRFFGPLSGIPEDPVTGSAHSTLGPYWAPRLRLQSMVARQVSARGGTLHLQMAGERLLISGPTALYMEGVLLLPESAAADCEGQ